MSKWTSASTFVLGAKLWILIEGFNAFLDDWKSPNSNILQFQNVTIKLPQKFISWRPFSQNWRVLESSGALSAWGQVNPSILREGFSNLLLFSHQMYLVVKYQFFLKKIFFDSLKLKQFNEYSCGSSPTPGTIDYSIRGMQTWVQYYKLRWHSFRYVWFAVDYEHTKNQSI